MNTTTKITTILLAALALAGCREEQLPVDGPIRTIAHKPQEGWVGLFAVYVVTVDGKDYVVASTHNGVAICPK